MENKVEKIEIVSKSDKLLEKEENNMTTPTCKRMPLSKK